MRERETKRKELKTELICLFIVLCSLEREEGMNWEEEEGAREDEIARRERMNWEFYKGE